MQVFYIFALLLALADRSTAFVTPTPTSSVATSSSNTALSMGFFDMFSEEARKERREREERAREEQEELQRQILERRRSPELFEEYEARVAVRRKLYMSGMDEEAKKMVVMTDIPKKDDEE